ncbi:type II secretion system protein GspF [Pseudomonas sp. SDI]|uniref:type II secretion system inner membrane protein GspF n=1 Tax=Pseudomonas sp. SDI TaxID=2170734 RepID=UPI000DE687AA|nr:type II secretion system inner membrane protein GspF [Pseudomonas sp. SDI]PWB31134.1 type II secretion system protein GspF [Pseudomonas sp. SDI]
MPRFHYRAQTAEGKRSRGVQTARDARHARQLLRARGLQVLALRPAFALNPGGWITPASLSVSQRVLLTRQLATLLQACMPLAEALHAVAAQSEARPVRQLMLDVAQRIAEGHTLAKALGHFPRAFPPLYCATVAAAERSGHLGLAFENLAEHSENQQLARQRIRLAMVYPLILMLASMAIVAFLLGYVVPDVVQVFVQNHQALPAMTQVLMALSEAVRRYGLLCLAAVGSSLLVLTLLLREPARRLRWHAVQLRLPVVGAVLRGSEAARAIRTLAILLSSGVPLVDALRIAAAVVVNLALRARLEGAVQALSEGDSLARSLERSATLPPLMLHMIASAERAGELERMLGRAAELQEKLLAARIALAVSLFEPLMLVLMGAVVLFIVLAILMPILNLNQLVN